MCRTNAKLTDYESIFVNKSQKFTLIRLCSIRFTMVVVTFFFYSWLMLNYFHSSIVTAKRIHKLTLFLQVVNVDYIESK